MSILYNTAVFVYSVLLQVGLSVNTDTRQSTFIYLVPSRGRHFSI